MLPAQDINVFSCQVERNRMNKSLQVKRKKKTRAHQVIKEEEQKRLVVRELALEHTEKEATTTKSGGNYKEVRRKK